MWLSVDPLANYNPFMDSEHYIDGDHNGGVYNHLNHNVYGYCYQNPITLLDPNGKQVKSGYLDTLGLSTNSSFANGVIDGFISNLDFTEIPRLIYTLANDPNARAGLIEMANKIADDPAGFVKDYVSKEYNKIVKVINGNGSEQDNYDVGERVGGLAFDIILAVFTLGVATSAKTAAKTTTNIITDTLKKLCFVSGTLVLTVTGLKPIEEIKVGDKVWSFNETTKEIELKEVVSLFKNNTNQLIEIFAGKETIVCTPEHPFYINGDWIEAKNLKIGDQLTLKNNNFVKISKLNPLEKIVTVYNFEVVDNHNYYVSELEILVHNNCWGSFKEAMSSAATKTKLQYQGASIYKVINKKNPYGLKKGDHYYLDNLHKDHVEVFDKNGNAKKVLNLDGTINADKTKKILDEKRTIDIK